IVVDPLNPADLFVGTDVGVFRSSNGGASWAAFGQFFPNVVVNHLRIFNSGGQVLLRASTHGRGVWQIPLGPDFAFAMNNTIAFDCASLPVGAGCSFNPPSVTLGPNQQTNVQVTLTGSNAVLGGTYGVTIEGLSAGAPAPRTATLNLFVADYSLSTNPRTREIYPGQMPPATYAGTISAANGYNFSVALGCAPGTTAPPASCLLDGAASETVSPPANFTLTASDVAIKDYNFNLQGVGGDPGAATRLLS